MKNKLKIPLIVAFLLAAVFYVLSIRSLPEKITYGASFSKFHSDELGLDWKQAYLAMLDDLKIRHIRLTAHWPMVEPEDGEFNFSELDFQMNEARRRGVPVILSVGRRLPGWPECHEPKWLTDREQRLGNQQEAIEFKQQRTFKYIEAVVRRYRNYENIKYWQVENEPHLAFFSRSLCGMLDEEFLQKEMDLVHKIDPSRQILVTDSGEFGLWYKAYRHHGAVFGTSMYLYVWWKWGPIRYPITPAFFRIKQSMVELVYGKKPKMIIELSAEPWLLHPIVDTSNEVLLSRMGIDKFNEVIDFASKTGFDAQYLWGAEWWYYMKTKQNHPEFWERARLLF
ncbi:MAG: beta-galactosidase [Candidatus Yanofskybacteria bacterium]|nr:beta-galactosidase [Candidatus Yanofskybacteria bacterium]